MARLMSVVKSNAVGRLGQLFEAELLEFRSHFDVHPISIEQDLRAGAIGWIATFVPEAISLKGRKKLWKVCTEVQKRSDFPTFGWYRISYLNAAQYMLDGDTTHVSALIANVDHHKSALRCGLHAPLALVSPRISLDDKELAQRIEHCLKSRFMYNESLMCIFSALRDARDRKIELILQWQKKIDPASRESEILDSIVTGSQISNDLVAEEFSKILRYLFCRLLDHEFIDNASEKQLNLFPDQSNDSQRKKAPAHTPQSSLFSDQSNGSLWERMSAHPLMNLTVSLRTNNR